MMPRLGLCASLLCLCSTALSDEFPESELDKPGVFGTFAGKVDDVQREASDRFNNFVDQIDGFFGTGELPSASSKSWARFRFDLSQPGDEDLKFRNTIKLRVVLPRTENRLQLLVSSEDNDTAISDPGSNTPVPEQTDGENLSLALRFIRTARRSSSINFDIGARIRDDKGQVFGRISAAYKPEQTGKWRRRINNNFFLYSASGYENKLNFDFLRTLQGRKTVFFRTNTGFNWRKGRNGARISETLGVYANISPRTSLAFEALASYATALNENQSKRFGGTEIRIRFRRNIWRPWLFYELWPSVRWPSSNGYERAYGGLIRMEFVIGQK